MKKYGWTETWSIRGIELVSREEAESMFDAFAERHALAAEKYNRLSEVRGAIKILQELESKMANEEVVAV